MQASVGVLALQGDFARHTRAVGNLGFSPVEVRHPSALNGLSGLVLPGGESSTLLSLLDPPFRRELSFVINSGVPTLATCAGLILIARGVENPWQESLSLLDIDVQRNGFGRQINSFIDAEMGWTEAGVKEFVSLRNSQNGRTFEGVWIRAPRITRIGSTVRVLAERRGEPMLVTSNSILGATFHPELSSSSPVYDLFAERIRKFLAPGKIA